MLSPASPGASGRTSPIVRLSSIPAPGQAGLSSPSGVAVTKAGRVFVADPGARCVWVFGADGRLLFSFDRVNDGSRTCLEAPVHIALAGDGEVLVTDRKLRGIYVFDLQGSYLRKFVRPKAGWAPLGVSVDDDGSTYVTDVGDEARHRVRVFNPSGMETMDFGRTKEVKTADEAPGAFYYPGRAVAHDGSIFVADSNNGRIQVFDSAGRYRYVIATGGVPRGIAFDLAGNLLVADTLGAKVDVLSPAGEQLGSLGSGGEFRFPNDVAVDGAGRIYVADRGTRTVQVWGEVSKVSAALRSGLPVRWAWLLLAIPVVGLWSIIVIGRGDEESGEGREATIE
jgi:DNA-binding beta-propeller fold protein YncE